MKEPKPQHRPVISLAIRPKADSDGMRLLQVLDEIAQEDPNVRIQAGQVDGQTALSGMDELHLESICDRILRQYKIEVDAGEAEVIYLETIRKQAEGEGRYIRQTGGSGNYGHVKLRIEPNETGKGIEFNNEVRGGVLPAEYIEPAEMGIREAARGGVLAGYELVDVKVSLFDGSFHEVDSNEMAFKIAGAIAFKEAARKACPIVLEPLMAVDVTVKEEFLGATMGDLNSRRGRIDSVAQDAGSAVVHAIVPLSEMLRSSRYGRPAYFMRFARYEQAPRRQEPGPDGPGVTANLPKRPKAGSGLNAPRSDAESRTKKESDERPSFPNE
jgi:elongation factor G